MKGQSSLFTREVRDGSAEEDPAGGGAVPLPCAAGSHVRGHRPVANEEAGEAPTERFRSKVQSGRCGGPSGGGHGDRCV